MRVAVVRKSDGWVLETRTVSRMRTLRVLREQNPDLDYVRVDGEGYDALACHCRVDGEMQRVEPEITARDVRVARFREFRDVTDPLTSGGRTHDAAMAGYVRALRDITDDGKGGKDETLDGMLRRFPRRPDGTDAVAHLRKNSS